MVFHYRKVIGNKETVDGTVPVMYVEGSCDSSETKPTDLIAEGSILVESDTGDVYFFNDKTTTWIKQFSFQGAGGE